MICGCLDDVGVPLASRVIDELRRIAGRLKSERADNEGGSLCAIDVRAWTGVARATAVAVAVTTYPSFFTGFFEVPVVPRAGWHIVKARDGWRGGENSTIQLDHKLDELRTVGRIATAEACLCGIEVACIDKSADGILVPHSCRNVAVRSKHGPHLGEGESCNGHSGKDFLQTRKVHRNEGMKRNKNKVRKRILFVAL